MEKMSRPGGILVLQRLYELLQRNNYMTILTFTAPYGCCFCS